MAIGVFYATRYGNELTAALSQREAVQITSQLTPGPGVGWLFLLSVSTANERFHHPIDSVLLRSGRGSFKIQAYPERNLLSRV